MAFIVFILLAIVLLLYILFSKRKKKAVLKSIGIIALYILVMNYICGPSSEDIKAIKPMADSMKNYILKHGMPENLEDIPDLPYRLYRNKKNPSFYYFMVRKDKYEILKKSQDMLEFSSKTKRVGGYTWLWLVFKVSQEGKYSLDKEIYFEVHRSGICQPMRQ